MLDPSDLDLSFLISFLIGTVGGALPIWAGVFAYRKYVGLERGIFRLDAREHSRMTKPFRHEDSRGGLARLYRSSPVPAGAAVVYRPAATGPGGLYEGLIGVGSTLPEAKKDLDGQAERLYLRIQRRADRLCGAPTCLWGRSPHHTRLKGYALGVIGGLIEPAPHICPHPFLLPEPWPTRRRARSMSLMRVFEVETALDGWDSGGLESSVAGGGGSFAGGAIPDPGAEQPGAGGLTSSMAVAFGAIGGAVMTAVAGAGPYKI